MKRPAIEAHDVENLRTEMNLSQTDFSAVLGVSPRTVRGWEGGAVIPDSAQFTLRLVQHCVQFPPSHAANKWGDDLRALLGLGK